MLCINSPWLNGSFSYFRFILTFRMPKYAVALGRKVGIYDTWNDCNFQVKNFPNAKFKKFNTKEEAEEFIKRFSSNSSVTDTMVQVKVENVNPPELIKVDKKLPSCNLSVLTDRVNTIEDRLGKFISDTTGKMETLFSRVNSLDGKRIAQDMASESDEVPPSKKRKEKPLVCDLSVNEDGFVKVYTDGACPKNGKTGAVAGIGVWFNRNHPLNISAPVQGPATNNNAEIQAARVAITQAARAGIKKLSIHTDSKFLIDCITQWIHKWKKNNWQLATGGPVKNKEELIKLDSAIQLLEVVEWNYVAGHKGVEGNEMADRLAREGASNYRINVTYSNQADDMEVKYFC